MPTAIPREGRVAALVTVTVLAAAVVAASGCRQTRPIPEYRPVLSLNANQPSTGALRPSLAGPAPAPVARQGGG